MSLLDVERVSSFYGDFQALYDVSLTVDAGETLAIIGANGAGKSTLLNVIAGLFPNRGGAIRFDGVLIDRLPAHQRVEAGISLVPEGRRVFPSLTVRENLLIGAYREAPRAVGRARRARALPACWPSAPSNGPRCCPAANSRRWPSVGR